ncbi:MAG: transcriptional repressor [Candidatus Obscuribacterales bacterium]|nr:transcriptional repressor [Candidatus Obscuribacterales bacterium]
MRSLTTVAGRGKIKSDGAASADDAPLEPVYESLRKKGHRITAQRETILEIFRQQAHGTHLSAEDLYSILIDHGTRVSLATTYRTLKLLSQLGLLRELDFAEGHKHYELKQDKLPHQHIICLGCNTTLEFEDHFLEEAGQKIGARYNFEVIDAQFKIFGMCGGCRVQKNPGRKPMRQDEKK